jgi:hypothetical protein
MDIMQQITFNQCKFYSGNMLTGFPALFGDAWNYGFDCQYASASNGGEYCKFLCTKSFFFFFKFILWKLNLRARIIFNPKLNLMGTTPLL